MQHSRIEVSGILGFRVDPTLHLTRPFQEAPQFTAFAPHKFPEFEKTNLLHLDAGVGLDPPKKIGASPGGEAMSFGGVPQEADRILHAEIITTKDIGVYTR